GGEGRGGGGGGVVEGERREAARGRGVAGVGGARDAVSAPAGAVGDERDRELAARRRRERQREGELHDLRPVLDGVAGGVEVEDASARRVGRRPGAGARRLVRVGAGGVER